MRWNVTRDESQDFGNVRVYRVVRVFPNAPIRGVGQQVWVSDGAHCTGCSTPLRAMSGSCPHVRAVKRLLARIDQGDA